MINAYGLAIELEAAGILDVEGCNSAGEVWDKFNNRIQSRPDVAAVIAAHNPQVWDAQQQADVVDWENTIALLKSEYPQAITTLENIQTKANPTNAEVIAAVKFEAKTLERLLKLLKLVYFG